MRNCVSYLDSRSFQWEAAQMAGATIIIRIRWYADVIALFLLTFMFLDVRQLRRHSCTDYCYCKRKSSAREHFKCGIGNNLLVLLLYFFYDKIQAKNDANLLDCVLCNVLNEKTKL